MSHLRFISICLLFFCTIFSLQSQDCLGTLFVEPFENCNPDGTFNIDISFENISGNNEGFNLIVNGDIYDSFSNYPEVFITIENFAIGNGQEINVLIQDIQDTTCVSSYTFIAPICEIGECEIFDVNFEVSECDENGNVFVVLNFEHSNTSDEFRLGGDGNGIVYSYSYLPITISEIPANGEILNFEIIDSVDENCFTEFEILLLDCQDECIVNDLFAEAYEDCNDDGSFNVEIEFEVTNGNESGFDVFVDGAFHSYFFTYPTDFVTINVNAAPNATIEIMVRDNDNENCFSTYNIMSPDCAGNITASINEISDNINIFISNATLFLIQEMNLINEVKLFISKSNGVCIQKEKVNNRSHQISLSDYPSGVYFVTLEIENSFYTEKIFIQ